MLEQKSVKNIKEEKARVLYKEAEAAKVKVIATKDVEFYRQFRNETALADKRVAITETKEVKRNLKHHKYKWKQMSSLNKEHNFPTIIQDKGELITKQ